MVISAVTFKYYFSLGQPILSITIAGAFLISISLLLLNYLKQNKHGFTREKLISDKAISNDLVAFIASQSLGGNKPSLTNDDNQKFGGGEFGGAGAGNKW